MPTADLLHHRTEPCDTCPTGIEHMVCWDGKRRCRNCVLEIAHLNGWDTPPDLSSTTPPASAEPDPPETATPVPDPNPLQADDETGVPPTPPTLFNVE